MQNIRTVFRVIGFERQDLQLNFEQSCIFWIYAKSQDEAIAKAKSYGVEKANYLVLEIIEKDDLDAS